MTMSTSPSSPSGGEISASIVEADSIKSDTVMSSEAGPNSDSIVCVTPELDIIAGAGMRLSAERW